MTKEILEATELARMTTELLEDRRFQTVIIDRFLKKDIDDIVYGQDVSSPNTQTELKARKILNDFLYGIISEAEKLKLEKENEWNK